LISLDLISRLRARLEELAPLIQVVLGPRQVGKATAIQQLLSEYDPDTFHNATTDAVFHGDWSWLSEQWLAAEAKG